MPSTALFLEDSKTPPGSAKLSEKQWLGVMMAHGDIYRDI